MNKKTSLLFLIFASFLLLKCNKLEEKIFISPSSEVFDAVEISSIGFTAHWKRVFTANQYILEVAKDRDFKQLESNSYLTNDTFIRIVNLDVNSLYYFRVRFKTGQIESSASNIKEVKTTSLLSPTAMAAKNTNQTSFEANWSRVYGANKYFISIAENENFSLLVSGYENKEVNDTSHLIQNLKANKNYYYRVKASSKSELSTASNGIKITTNDIGIPVLLGAIQANYLSFLLQWRSIAQSQSYVLDVAKDANFLMLESAYRSRETLDTSLLVTGLDPETTYFYRLRSKGLGSISSFSSSQSIKTSNLPSPFVTADNAKSEYALAFFWQEVDGVDNYKIELSLDPSFGVLTKEVFEKSSSVIINALQPNTMYFYRIFSIRNGILSTKPEVRKLKTQALPVAFNLKAIEISQFQFLLTWELAGSIVDYELDLSTDAEFAKSNVYMGLKITGNSYLVKNLQPFTTYYYRLRSISLGFISSNTPTEEVRTISIPSPTHLTASTINLTEFNLDWNPIEGVSEFLVDVSKDPTFSTNNTIVAAHSFDNKITIRNLEPNQTYYCKLRSFSNGYSSEYSSVLQVKTNEIPAPTVAPILKSEHSIFNITFHWQKVAQAVSYVYEIANDPSFKNIVSKSVDNEVVSNYVSFRSLDFKKTIYFRIRAKYLNFYSDYSSVLKIDPIVSPNCGLESVNGKDRFQEFTYNTNNQLTAIQDIVTQSTKSNYYYKIIYDGLVISSIEKWTFPLGANYVEKWVYKRNLNKELVQLIVQDKDDNLIQVCQLTYDSNHRNITKMDVFKDEVEQNLISSQNYSYNNDNELTTVTDQNGFTTMQFKYADYLNPYASLSQEVAMAIRYNGGFYLPMIPVRAWELEYVAEQENKAAFLQTYSYRGFFESSNANDLKIPESNISNISLNYLYNSACNFIDFKE